MSAKNRVFDPVAYENSPAFLRTKSINDNAHKLLAVNINGLPLPSELLRLMVHGRWRMPEDSSKLIQRFPGEVSFYSLGYLPFENAHWVQETESMWFGTPSAETPPGDIDQRKSVLIADLGPGTDQPIALDYRQDERAPRVLVLEHEPMAHWVQIASSIEDFATQFGMT